MKTKQRILYIIPNKFWGGGQQYIYELSQQLQETQTADLYYIGRKYSVSRERFSTFGPFLTLPLKSIIDLYSIFRIGYLIWTKHINVVHAHIPKDAILAVFGKKLFCSKCKIIMTRHLVRPGKFNLLYRWAYKHIDKYIFVSHTAEDGFFATAPKNIQINNCIIYNSIRGTRSSNNQIDLRSEYQLDHKINIIGFAGRLAFDKGPGILIQAFEQSHLPNTVLIFAGDIEDNYRPQLNALLDQCKVRDKIFFHPYVEDIYNFINQLDILVVPSIVKEACPLILLEAMQQAQAIITANNGAQSELVEDGREAILIPPNDVTALGTAITKLIQNPELRKYLGQNALEKSKQFNYNQFFQKMTEVYGIKI